MLIGVLAGVLFAFALNGFQGILEPLISGINFFWVPGLSTSVALFVGALSSRIFPCRDPATLKHLMVR